MDLWISFPTLISGRCIPLDPLEQGQISTAKTWRFYGLSVFTTTRRCAGLGRVRARRALRASDKLGIELIQHAREGDGFANVFQAADPGYRAFDAHPEARMRHGTELAQIQVPFERFFRKPMLL